MRIYTPFVGISDLFKAYANLIVMFTQNRRIRQKIPKRNCHKTFDMKSTTYFLHIHKYIIVTEENGEVRSI